MAARSCFEGPFLVGVFAVLVLEDFLAGDVVVLGVALPLAAGFLAGVFLGGMLRI